MRGRWRGGGGDVVGDGDDEEGDWWASFGERHSIMMGWDRNAKRRKSGDQAISGYHGSVIRTRVKGGN